MKSEPTYTEIFEVCRKYLVEIASCAETDTHAKIELGKDEIKKYMTPECWLEIYNDKGLNVLNTKDFRFIMCRLAASLQNRNRMQNTIQFMKNFYVIKDCLFEFDPHKIHNEFGDNNEKLLDQLRIGINSTGISKIQNRPQTDDTKEMIEYSRTFWFQFAKGLLSGAKYLSSFGSAEGFFLYFDKLKSMYTWCVENYVSTDVADRMLDVSWKQLSDNQTGISGFRDALATDFLKEIGFTEFGKPDTHIIDIFSELKLCNPKSNSEIQKTLRAIAAENNVTPYEVDKTIWLICAKGGKKFYLHPNIRVKNQNNSKLELLKKIKELSV